MTSRDLALAALASPNEYQATHLRAMAQAEYARESLRACTECSLHTTRTNPVPWSGWMAPILLVGEAPGADEDVAGEPFVGRSGKYLRQMCAEAGLRFSGASDLGNPAPRYSLANTIGCRPPMNDYSAAVKADAPARCRPHLMRALSACDPSIVIAVGKKAESILSAPPRGEWAWHEGRLLSSIFHPAYLLRKRGSVSGAGEYTHTIRTLRKAAQIASMETVLPEYGKELPEAVGIDWGPAGKTKRKSLVNQRERFESHYARVGWVVVFSPVLGEQVVIHKPRHKRIPAEYKDLVRYTPEELARMRGNREGLRRAHAAKAVLGGEFIV